MSTASTHFVTTPDGVVIGGTVHGQGPSLVLVHGALGDGDIDWQPLLPHLAGRFTCHLPSQRGRGRSGGAPDIGRMLDDVLTYVDSIGGPTGLVGWSGGAAWGLAATAQSDAVDAVAAVEPPMDALRDEQEQAAMGAAVTRMGQLAAEGRSTDAVRALAAWPLTDHDLAAAEAAGYIEAAGRYVPNTLAVFGQLMQYQGPLPGDPAVLGAISVPTLMLHGSDTKPFFARSARYVADHVPGARLHEIPGAGHAIPLTHPEELAEVLTDFFAPARNLA
ncbi:alpha/beta fold hydrolase [Blastococcus sp. VKM Ac-2987]|uniref:alpha/beta fold hydrolase n=1 Tax=Blastococcus sp. VKM Ac-2987 TaxID=3004141 RepID=UPI0022ABA9A5|nr:alpha/beta hydrolase [Blastococcus sp. VKM Ac-2987]MCZ2857447.1 alpha/beta hydrolase [Blastococcus sp. VKM Ac-2987]